MQRGQKSVGFNGYDNALFPLEYMYLTQGEYSHTYSHNGTYAMDFQGWGANGRVYNCPYYAPVDCHCVAIWGSTSPMIVWESDDKVNYVDGRWDYMTIGFVHDDDTPDFQVGDTCSQGDVIGHTGTYGNASGDHVHIEVAEGRYRGYHQNAQGVWQLNNEEHIYDCLGVNDTVMVKDYYVNQIGETITYPWEEFNIPPVPPIPTNYRKGKFPWVLYARRLRSTK